MSIANRFKTAKQHLESAMKILEGDVSEIEYNQIKSAAAQAQQASNDLYMIAGELDGIKNKN
jgi:hypothetical protein